MEEQKGLERRRERAKHTQIRGGKSSFFYRFPKKQNVTTQGFAQLVEKKIKPTGILVTGACLCCIIEEEEEEGAEGVPESSSSSELRTMSPSSSTGRTFPLGTDDEPGNEFRPMESYQWKGRVGTNMGVWGRVREPYCKLIS